MNNPRIFSIAALLEDKSIKKTGEFKINISTGALRLDLTKENITLWNQTNSKVIEPCNLLLACESEDCDIIETSLTWVVGSAIRPFFAKSREHAITLLNKLGVNKELSELVNTYCPGLGQEVTWAFFIDRHGSLTGTPVIDLNDLTEGPS